MMPSVRTPGPPAASRLDVSVIIPAYNGAALIGNQLDALQTMLRGDRIPDPILLSVDDDPRRQTLSANSAITTAEEHS